MTSKVLNLSISVAMMAILAALLAAACGGGEPEELQIPVRVKGETLTPETVKVKQGDMVTLQIQVEESGEFHLHGYDIEKEIEAGEITDFFFVADATGRFRITFHHSGEGEGEHGAEGAQQEGEGGEKEEGHEEGEEGEIDIGFLEVGPR